MGGIRISQHALERFQERFGKEWACADDDKLSSQLILAMIEKARLNLDGDNKFAQFSNIVFILGNHNTVVTCYKHDDTHLHPHNTIHKCLPYKLCFFRKLSSGIGGHWSGSFLKNCTKSVEANDDDFDPIDAPFYEENAPSHCESDSLVTNFVQSLNEFLNVNLLQSPTS